MYYQGGRLPWAPFPPPACVQTCTTACTGKINAWRLNECGECWIDRNSKLGQQDCLFKGQDPLIIVLAEIESQARTAPSLTLLFPPQLNRTYKAHTTIVSIGISYPSTKLNDCLCQYLFSVPGIKQSHNTVIFRNVSACANHTDAC